MRFWRCRGHEGGQGQLGQLLPMAPRTRLDGEGHRRRQVYGDAGGRGRGVSGRQIPAARCISTAMFSVVPQIQAKIVAKMLKAIHAQESKGVPREGKGCGRRAARHEAEGGCQEGRGRH